MNGASGWRMMVLAALVCAGHSAAQDAEGLWTKAQESYDEFTWDRAIAGFEQFVAKFPGDARVPEAKFKILHARYRLERYDEFEAALTAFCEEYRRTVWGARGRELLAQHLFRSQRWSNWERIGTLYAEALRDYRSAVGRRPFTADEKKTYIQMLFGAAEFYSQWYAERSRELAEEHLRSIIQYNLDPETTAKAWVRLGDLQRGRLEQADKAEESWLKVVREYATTSFADDALWRLADLDYDRGNYVRCRARLLLLRQKYPKSDLEDNAKQRIAEIEAPRLSLQLSQTHLPGANIPARLIARNLKGVRFTVWRLDLLAAIQKVGLDLSAASDLTKLGEQVGTWRQDVKDAGDYQYVESKFNAPLKGPGVFVVEAVAEGRRGVTDHALVNITSLVLVQQLAAQKLVNYVASRADRQPVAGVELTVLRRTNKNAVRAVLRGTTNADGLHTASVPARANDDDWRLLSFARKGDEVAFQFDGLYSWWSQPEVELDGYLYTDRPVYRPENTVHYRAILRRELDGEFTNLPSEKVQVTITDAKGEEIQKTSLQTDAYGTVQGELVLGAEPALGVYQVHLETAGRSVGGQFRVEEYRKPEFKVEVGKPLADVRPGGAAAIPITATYYFGAPVADAEVKYVIQRRPYWHYYWFPRPWDWFYAGWREHPGRYQRQQVVREGTIKTDAQGQAILEFATTEDQTDYTYTIYAEVADVTRRVVDATGSLTVTHKAYFLFANANQGLYAPEDTVTATVKAENADRQPVEVPVTATLWKMKWVPETLDPKTKKVATPARYERDAKVWDQDVRQVTDPSSGQRAIQFKAPADGYYQLACSAPDRYDPNATVDAVADFWVASKAWKGVNYNHANLTLVTEQDLYQKGETARVLVNSPVPDGALLLTIGATAILDTKVIRFTGNSNVIEVPILTTYAPNVFISATVVGVRQVYFAGKELMVPPTDRMITVKLTSDQAEYKPRTKGTFSIQTTDQNGRPVPAQVSLGISDESVYAIQEELASPIAVHYYGRKRYDQIRTACSFEGYGEYDDEFAQKGEERARRTSAPGRADGMAGGLMLEGAPPPSPAMAAPMAAEAAPDGKAARNGGGGGAEEPVAIREFFPDTILWQPTVTTDAAGQATLTVDFPDSLTTWRATARAVTKDTMVGQQVEHVISTKDLIARLQAPRFFTQLDEATISVVVTNKTSRQQQVAVGLEVAGLELVGAKTDSVVVAPNGQARVDRTVKAVEPGQATITVTARGPEDSDGVKQTYTVIPHGADKFQAAAGRVEASGVATFTLDLPAARREEATRLTVNVAPTLVSAVLDALPYLVEYPYGCVEQTTSKFLPAVMVARTLDYTGRPAAGGKPQQVPAWWQSRGLDELPAMVNLGVKRLRGMQNPDGGFGWFGGMRSDVWMTAYVTYGLLQARLADFAVPNEVLDPAARFLATNLHLLRGQVDSTAYVSWVLSDLVKAQVLAPNAAMRKDLEDAFQRVYANRDELNDYTRALLILTAVNRGEKDKAQVVWRNLQARRIETANGCHWGRNQWGWRWSEDQVESTAFALLAALAVEPDSPLADKAVQWLTMNRTGSRWYNTKDTAAAIFALATFADQKQELRAEYTLTLVVNGTTVKGWEVTPQNALTVKGWVEVDPKLLKTGANTIELRRSGTGNAYYGALLEYYTKEDPITAASSYVSATRKYYKVTEYTDPADNVRKTRRDVIEPGATIASGEQIDVEVTVEAENEYSYICLADPKPAGCEPVDQTSGGTWGGTYMYRELRDEAVTFFIDHLPQGKTTFSYRLRAESPGTFRALPHHGFSMYRPDVRCLSDEAIVRIGERPAAVEG